MAFFSNLSPTDRLGKLIEDVANSGCKELKQSDLKEFKSLCKNGDDDLIDFAYRIMIMQLEKNHCQKRYSTMLLIEQLFPRSHRFRTVFTEQSNLNDFFGLTLASELPKPRVYAKLLREKVNLLTKQWIDQFGIAYPYLEQVYKLAISRTLRLDQPADNDDQDPIQLNAQINSNIDSTISANLNGRTRAEQDVINLREARLQDKITEKLVEFSSLENELPAVLVQVKSCFDLIIPKDEFALEEMNNKNDREIDHEMGRLANGVLTKQKVSITLKPFVEILVDSNNEDAIVMLKELYKQLVNGYLPKIKNLLKHLSKGGTRCEQEVKQLIEFKNQGLRFISMYAELRFKNEHDCMIDSAIDSAIDSTNGTPAAGQESSTDDEDFEEVEEKDVEWEIPPERWTEYGIAEPFVNKYSQAPGDPNQPSTSGLQNAIGFDPNACNVRLENGSLCPRKDKVKCPFHGKLQARDHEGKPLDPEVRKQEEEEAERRQNDWQDPQYLKDLENQIGIDLTIKKTKKKKNPELLNLKTCDETPKSRLMKRMRILKR